MSRNVESLVKVILLAGGLVCWITNAAVGQPAKGAPGGAEQQFGLQSGSGLEIVEVEGELVAFAPNQIMVAVKGEGEEAEKKLFVLGSDTTLRYHATADPSMLRPGMLVRFTVTLDPQTGMPAEPVGQIEIFRPIHAKRMTPDLVQSQTPGIYPIVNKERKNQAGAGQPPQRGFAPGQQLPGQGGPQKVRVVGKILGMQGDKMQIGAGRTPVIITVAPDVKITVTTGDLAFARVGDKVKVNGLAAGEQSAIAQAEIVQISAKEPLTFAPQEVQQRNSRSRRLRGQTQNGPQGGSQPQQP